MLMKVEERFKLISRNTKEIIGEEELKELLAKGREIKAYLGTAITGLPHIGYLLWVTKFGDLIKAGIKTKVLLADLHGALDNTPWDLLNARYEFYKIAIPAMFEALQIQGDVEIVTGSSYQTSKDYVYDIYRMSTVVSIRDGLKATSEVVKQSSSPKVSGLIYAIMQALDEQYLDVDIQIGGNDQRKVLVFAREFLPKIGYKRRVEMLLPLIPSFNQSGKMSSSSNAKIGLLDTEKEIFAKMKKAFCPETVEDNGVTMFIKLVLFPYLERQNRTFLIERPEKWGGNLEYKSYEDFEKEYLDKKVHPFDVKMAVAREINNILTVIRKKFEGKEDLVKKAYKNE